LGTPGQHAAEPYRQRLRLQGFDYGAAGYVYFITIHAADGSAPFRDPHLAAKMVECLHFQRQSGRASVHAFALMPDHIHVVLSATGRGVALPEILRDFKGYTTHLYHELGFRGPLWQRSFYDHVVRRQDDLVAICQYVLANPVRRGLVEEADDWPYSGMPDPLPI
jgi:putative transposase